jgi:hypothetical protein
MYVSPRYVYPAREAKQFTQWNDITGLIGARHQSWRLERIVRRKTDFHPSTAQADRPRQRIQFLHHRTLLIDHVNVSNSSTTPQNPGPRVVSQLTAPKNTGVVSQFHKRRPGPETGTVPRVLTCGILEN